MPRRPRPERQGRRPWRGANKPPGRGSHHADTDQVLLFGLHAVEAALANPRREVVRLIATENAAYRLAPLIAERGVRVEPASPRDLDRLLGPDSVHQGAALEAKQLSPVGLDEVESSGIVVVLDQVTDPHNVGAVLRSAAAFGASGLVLTERHSPPLSGALAKVASGALDLVPIVLVKNLAQALAELGEMGFLRVGLAEEGENALEAALLDEAARPRARRRGQRPPSPDPRALRSPRPHLDAKHACESQRLERSRHCAALGQPQREGLEASSFAMGLRPSSA